MLILSVVLASILALTGRALWGRLGGICVTAVASTMIAFFVMPPIFSFRVSQARDVMALTLYGTIGLLAAGVSTLRKKDRFVQREPSYIVRSEKPVETDLGRAVQNLISSDFGSRLSRVSLAVPREGYPFPGTGDELNLILSGVLAAALQVPDLQGVSIYGGQRPGMRRLVVVAHYKLPIPSGKSIVSGKRDEDCVPVIFSGWPPRWHATWFDNGYERIYQVTTDLGAPTKH